MNKWCQECAEKKKKRKEIAYSKEAISQQVGASNQNALFEESLRNFVYENKSSRTHPREQCADFEANDYCTFNDQNNMLVFREIKRLASIYMDNYIAERPQLLEDRQKLSENYDQWLWVYVTLLLPVDLLNDMLFRPNEKQNKSNFRKLCILVHPDKNSHELASKAFQKLLSAFQAGPAAHN